MKSILIVLIALLACLVVLASCDHTIKTKHTSKDSLVLESTNKNEDTIEFMFKNSESFPLIGVKLVRQVPVSSNSSSQQASSSGSQNQQQSGSQQSSQTVRPQSSTPPGQQQEQANGTVITGSSQQQQQSNASAQAASQQSSQSSNQTQTVEKQDNPQSQSSSQAGSQGTSSSSQAATPQSGQNQNSTASSASTSQSTPQGSSSSSQSTSQTAPISNDTSSISGDTNMNLTPNITQSTGNETQPSDNTTTTQQPSDNSTVTASNTTLINETLQNIGVSNSTAKEVNITDIIGRIISGENITEIINNTLGNLTQWLNITLGTISQNNSQQSRSLRRRLLSLLESNEENEDFAQYLKFNTLKLMSSEGETLKEIPLSDSNIHWNYGHSVVHNNEQAFKVPHVDVEIPLSTASRRPTLKIRTMMTEAPSHIERNGRDIQLNPRSMDIQISLNNLHDLLSEQEKKLSGTRWSIETEMSSTNSNSLHLMQTKNLNGIQKVVVMGNNFTPKGQFTFSSSPHMKVIQDSDNGALISIQTQDSSNSIQLNPIKFGVH